MRGTLVVNNKKIGNFQIKEGVDRSDFKLKKLFNVAYDIECSKIP
jgi:hypothetical protein